MSSGGGGSSTPFAAASNLPPPQPMASRPPEAAGGGPGPLAAHASFNLASLSNLLGGDLSRLPQLAGLTNFPSLPPVRSSPRLHPQHPGQLGGLCLAQPERGMKAGRKRRSRDGLGWRGRRHCRAGV
jgi:hypothetical protein